MSSSALPAAPWSAESSSPPSSSPPPPLPPEAVELLLEDEEELDELEGDAVDPVGVPVGLPVGSPVGVSVGVCVGLSVAVSVGDCEVLDEDELDVDVLVAPLVVPTLARSGKSSSSTPSRAAFMKDVQIRTG